MSNHQRTRRSAWRWCVSLFVVMCGALIIIASVVPMPHSSAASRRRDSHDDASGTDHLVEPAPVHTATCALLTKLLGRKDPLRIACAGDSITYGNGTHIGRKERDGEGNYPLELAQMLRSSGISNIVVRNFGKSGRTASTTLMKFSYRHQREFTDSVKFAPHVVILLLGTNDSKPRHWVDGAAFTRNLTMLVEAYAALSTKPLIIICIPPPAYPIPTARNLAKNVPSVLGKIDPVVIRRDIRAAVISFALSPTARRLNVHPSPVDLINAFDAEPELSVARRLLRDPRGPTKVESAPLIMKLFQIGRAHV